MNERAEKVKKLLWSHGIGSASPDSESDHIVALYLEKSPETYLSFIGVLKAGAAWCPIDTDWPASRRQALLAKSNAKVVLTHDDKISKQLQEDLESEDVKSKGGMKAIRLDQLDKELQQVHDEPTTIRSRSIEQLAYMIWTSGTTGLPKGVGIQHLAIIQAMRALRLYIPYGKDKIGTDQIRYLQYSAYNFDLSIMDCFYTWGLGGAICSCPRGVLLQDLVDVGNSIKPTHTLLTPAVMAMTERHRVPSLKVVISGGEKLSQVVADEWSKDCCLLNLYGPAEATLIAMNRRVPFGDRVKAPNIGVALPTVSCHALDKYDRVVLKGAVGELVLGGPQLARGYVGDPVKTADKFFPHPELAESTAPAILSVSWTTKNSSTSDELMIKLRSTASVSSCSKSTPPSRTVTTRSKTRRPWPSPRRTTRANSKSSTFPLCRVVPRASCSGWTKRRLPWLVSCKATPRPTCLRTWFPISLSSSRISHGHRAPRSTVLHSRTCSPTLISSTGRISSQMRATTTASTQPQRRRKHAFESGSLSSATWMPARSAARRRSRASALIRFAP